MESKRLEGPPPRTDYMQDKMVAEDVEGKGLRTDTLAELSRNLPAFPHEIELKGELEDEEELLGLYREVS